MLSFSINIDETEDEGPEPEEPFNKGCQDQGRHQCYIDHL